MSSVAPGPSPQPRIDFNVIGVAWQMLSQQLGTWVLAMLVVVLINVALAFTVGIVLALCVPLVGNLVAQIPSQLMVIGLYRMAFKQMRGETIAVGDVFQFMDVLGPAAVATILVTIAVITGTIFCIVPGILLAGVWMFTFPLIADKGMDGVQAMGLSWNTLKADWLMAALFFFVNTLIGVAGALACGVGVLVTAPLSLLSLAGLYRVYFPEPSTEQAPVAV